MILLNDFFTIRSLQQEENSIKAELEINAAHAIFNGHFPNQPVVPGVCMMQMLKELLEQAIQKPTLLTRGDDMKFLAVIDPVVNNIIAADVRYTVNEDGTVAVNASLFKNELVHFKFKGVFSF